MSIDELRLENTTPDAAVRRGRRGRSRLGDVAAFLTLFAVVVVTWELIPRLGGVSEFVLPPPSLVVEAMTEDAGQYWTHGLVTAQEIGLGFVAGSVVGFLSAVAIFYSPFFRRAVYPLLLGFRIVPKVAFLPLFLIWFGIGLGSKIALATFAIFFLVLVQTMLGLASTEPEQIELGRSLRMSEFLLFLKIRLPSALPALMVGFKLAITYALTNVIVAEMAVAAKGLGYVAVLAQSDLRTASVIGVIIVVSVIGLILYGIGLLIERRVTFWYGNDDD
ncbi:MAG: ABC transporter permease subunit [Streptosporangiales bacterium]|nr:ABC transporter permease subunit [Streptosporangiales bacterium]